MLAAAFFYAALADPSCPVRDLAEHRLTRLAGHRPAVGEAVASWAREATSPEVAFRCRRPARAYRYRLAAAYVPSTCPVWPACDCFPAAGPLGLDVRDRGAWRGWTDDPYPAGTAGPYWSGYRRVTEDRVRQLIREGADPAAMDDLLRRAWALEVAAGSDCPGAGPIIASWAGWVGYPQPPAGGNPPF